MQETYAKRLWISLMSKTCTNKRVNLLSTPQIDSSTVNKQNSLQKLEISDCSPKNVASTLLAQFHDAEKLNKLFLLGTEKILLSRSRVPAIMQ